MFVDNKYVSPDTWYDEQGKPFQPQVHYFVGGATKLYGAALYRLRQEDFGELRHHDGISPAWPISYDELEPYYTQAEQLYEVHGARGEDPTEPPRERALPVPGRLARAADPAALRRPRGRRATTRSMRRAASGSNEANMPYSACVRCQNCDGFPCAVHGKSDAEVLGVRPALEHAERHAADERAGRQARDERGRHGGHRGRRRARRRDRALRGRRRRRSPAAPRTRPRCSSRSANDRHPNGLANGSDQVGRNYMFHASQAVLALSRDENPTVFQKTLGLNDFYFGSDEDDFPLGNIQMVGKSQAPMFRGEKPGETRLAPQWTLERIARHAIDFWLSTEDLPLPENRVTVDGDGRLTLAYTADERRPEAEAATGSCKSMLGKLDMNPDHLIHRFAYMKNEIPVAGVAHQAGTCRFGSDPATSALERRLPRARARQPLRRRHERLPDHRRGEPGADRDGELAPRRRPPARADGVSTPRASAERRRVETFGELEDGLRAAGEAEAPAQAPRRRGRLAAVAHGRPESFPSKTGDRPGRRYGPGPRPHAQVLTDRAASP